MPILQEAIFVGGRFSARLHENGKAKEHCPKEDEEKL
jgi:hypothetical protein